MAGDDEATRRTDRGSDEASPVMAAAVIRARVASLVADVMSARRRLAEHREETADEEAVHDYRVALRRLRSSLRALRPAWGKGRLLPLEEELKALADATGDVRDEEVLQETLARVPLDAARRSVLERWSAGRARRLRGARAAAARKLGGRELGDRLAEALRAIGATLAEPPRRPMTLEELRARSLGRMLDDVLTLARTTSAGDVAGMHRLRIRIKRVRYALDLMFGDDAPTGAARKAATRLQKRLGDLHDVDEADVRMARAWGLEADVRGAIAGGLKTLRDQSARKAQKDIAACVPELEREIAQLLGAPPTS